MANTWFVIRRGEEKGPFSGGQLKELVARGKLRPTDLVRRDDLPAARPASAIKGLFPKEETAVLTTATAAASESLAIRSAPAEPESVNHRIHSKKKLVVLSVVSMTCMLLCCGGLGLIGALGNRTKNLSQKNLTDADRATAGGWAKQRNVSPSDQKKLIAEVEASNAVVFPAISDAEYKYDYTNDDYSSIPSGAKREKRKRVITGRADGDGLNGKPETIEGYVDQSGRFVSHGTFITWTDDSQTKKLREGKQLHGKIHGLMTFYYPSGAKRWEQYFVNDKNHGIARFWHENGKMSHLYHSVDGRFHGTCRTWFETGAMESDQTWLRGKRHGVHKRWWKDGKLASVIGFRDGKRHGKSFSWNEDGSPGEGGEWDDGRPKGRCRLAFSEGNDRWYFVEADDGEWRGGTTEEFIARMCYYSLRDQPDIQLQFDPRSRIANYSSVTAAEFFARFGTPSQETKDFEKAPFGAPPFIQDKYRIWIYRCRDGNVTLHVQPTQSGSLLVTSRP